MAEGRIKWFNGNKGYGFIERKGEDDLFIHINQWCGPLGSEPREGDRVTFEVGPGRKGKLKAKDARPVGIEPVRPVKETRRKVTPTRPGGYCFLNPYNFVRPLSQSRLEGDVLGNCPPPPHDRYVDGLLTGRITCKVTAVTPLFVSDSHDVKGKVGEHRSFRFFTYEEDENDEGKRKPALPASSLRGMIRSVFETVTNSCFAVFTDKRLSYRFNPRKAPQLVPARVEKRDGTWRLHLLTGTTPLQVGREPRGEQYAAWIHRYWPMRPSGTLSRPPQNARTREFQQRTRLGTEVDLKGLQHGSECYALVTLRTHPFPRIRFWDMLAVSRDLDDLERRRRHGQRVVRGWLCLTNQNVEPKHSERFLFRDPDNRVGPEHIELPGSVHQAYEDLIADYQERHAEAVDKRKRRGKPLDAPISEKDAALSRFIYTKKDGQLRDGTLVYAYLSGTVENPKVESIAPVLMPRVSYERTTGELLPDYASACAEYEHLCPACRVFGWVRQVKPGKHIPLAVRTAYAGRVRLTHARPCYDENGNPLYSQMKDENGNLKHIPLAILSSPKPTTTQFYLLRNRQTDGHVNYDDSNAQLRGRKFYRHHGDEPSKHAGGKYEYERVGDVRDDQNRSVRGVVKKGSAFEFDLEFENLHPLELGALLWALELEKGMYHRLGYGKPLGFGSVTLKVDRLGVLNPEKRYSDLSSDGWDKNRLADKEGWVGYFLKKMRAQYGDEAFDDLLAELRALLSAPPFPAIHYPREDEKPTEEGENFRWFVKNKRRKDPHPLELVAEDSGLPIRP